MSVGVCVMFYFQRSVSCPAYPVPVVFNLLVLITCLHPNGFHLCLLVVLACVYVSLQLPLCLCKVICQYIGMFLLMCLDVLHAVWCLDVPAVDVS